MQVKKDEVRQDLLDAAGENFLTRGYESASIRQIVKDAGTTIGNFYNYFDSKAEIFAALAEEMYDHFVLLLDHHGFENRDELMASTDNAMWRDAVSDALSPLLRHMDETFLLLIEQSAGTRFSDLKERLLNLLTEHFDEHIREFMPQYAYPEIGRIIATGLLSGICETIRTIKSPEKRTALIAEQIIFAGVGFVGLYKGEKNDSR